MRTRKAITFLVSVLLSTGVLANTGSDTVQPAQISQSVVDDTIVSDSISSKLSGSDAFSVSVDGNNFVITASGDSCAVLTDTIMGQLSEGDSLAVSVEDDVCTISITSETFAFSEQGTKGLQLEGEDQTELAGASEEEQDEAVAQEAVEPPTDELVAEQQKPAEQPQADDAEQLAKAHEAAEDESELSKLQQAISDAEQKRPDGFDYANNKLRYNRTHSKSFPLPQMESDELATHSLGGLGNDEETDGTETAKDSLPGAETALLAFWDRKTLEDIGQLDRTIGLASYEESPPRILPEFYNNEFLCTSSAAGTGCFTPPETLATVRVTRDDGKSVSWTVDTRNGEFRREVHD